MNPNPMRELDVTAVGTVMAAHGYDQFIIIATKEGEDGGETICHVGIDGRNAHIAAAKANAIRDAVLGWDKSEEAKELDKLAAETKKEMATGPEHDPNYGKKLIITERFDRKKKLT